MKLKQISDQSNDTHVKKVAECEKYFFQHCSSTIYTSLQRLLLL